MVKEPLERPINQQRHQLLLFHSHSFFPNSHIILTTLRPLGVGRGGLGIVQTFLHRPLAKTWTTFPMGCSCPHGKVIIQQFPGMMVVMDEVV